MLTVHYLGKDKRNISELQRIKKGIGTDQLELTLKSSVQGGIWNESFSGERQQEKEHFVEIQRFRNTIECQNPHREVNDVWYGITKLAKEEKCLQELLNCNKRV